jgi:hypothetical protein
MSIMRPTRWTFWMIRRFATGALVALWLVGLSAAAVSHGGPASEHLLSDAFAATLIWFVLRFPRVVPGVILVSVLSFGLLARPRRRC